MLHNSKVKDSTSIFISNFNYLESKQHHFLVLDIIALKISLGFFFFWRCIWKEVLRAYGAWHLWVSLWVPFQSTSIKSWGKTTIHPILNLDHLDSNLNYFFGCNSIFFHREFLSWGNTNSKSIAKAYSLTLLTIKKVWKAHSWKQMIYLS